MLEERGKDPGEPSFRADYRRIERMAKRDLASGAIQAPDGWESSDYQFDDPNEKDDDEIPF